MSTIKPPGNIKVARDLMTTRLTKVQPETDVAAAIRLLVRHNISGMPVVDADGKYVGVFAEKSCLKALLQTAATLSENGLAPACARDFMITDLYRLKPDEDVFEAIGCLLRRRISGAPVVDSDEALLGVFSEKNCMSVLVEGAYEGLPSADVRAFMNTDRGRIIAPETDLLTIARMFVDTSYRRLEVVNDGRLCGQISRRDVLRNSRLLASVVRDIVAMADESTLTDESKRAAEARDWLSSSHVGRFMDTAAKTIGEDEDLLTLAQIFLTTPYRRLPVLRDQRVVGQVSRRDVLAAVYQMIQPTTDRRRSLLYLSAVVADGEPNAFD